MTDNNRFQESIDMVRLGMSANRALDRMIEENALADDEPRLIEEGVVQKKPTGKWGVLSTKTGKFWDADYDSEADAQAGLKAYHANKS